MCEVYYDGDSPKFIRDEDRRARKDHRCNACRGVIKAGERYRVIAMGFDDHVSTEKCCAPCAADIDAYAKSHAFTWMPSGILEGMEECFAMGEPGWLAWGKRIVRLKRRASAARAGETS